ncbi:hypothetical protein [Streptomyces qinzhouensis]|uniref:Uncharacterized protein n=1 Tax=Streptomyces qinzhouensis TaxID=2599401 RepID=A0A5B8JAF9_9ACTN|nr:hypothetical protein [Streptomyces qinzhouensis]QDY77424.1 hypothetical protein FQU76_13820 [Streptomyces qinzhouensis]
MHTRISAAGQAVNVTSVTPAVCKWAARYFSVSWDARCSDGTRCLGAAHGPLVDADVDAGALSQLTRYLLDHPYRTAAYAGSAMLYRYDDEDGTVSAVQPGLDLACHYQPGSRQLHIVGGEEEVVASAAARFAREMVRAGLQRDGWQILHAAAAVRNGEAVLILGPSGAGKTTCALLLAGAGWRLLAHDRVFVRVEEGRVRLLPWPAAASIGLGLLDALGMYDGVRARLLCGERLHPTQRPEVTEALSRGSRAPLRHGSRELKAQFFPDQLGSWLGVETATEGYATSIVYPRVALDEVPEVKEAGRPVSGDDFVTAVTEDRYPDVLGLLGHDPDGPARRETVRSVLAGLPSYEICLGHGIAANTRLLTEVTEQS